MTGQTVATTVFIVDDHLETARSLGSLLTTLSLRNEVYGSGPAFLRRCSDSICGCLVLDLLMPEMSGLEVLAELRQMGIEIPVIMMSAHGDIASAVSAMKMGAIDFLQKPYSSQLMINRIHEALRLNAARDIRNRLMQSALSAARAMTAREREVLKKMAEGCSTKEIANHLGISTKTVDVHRMHILEKMKANSTNQLIVMGVRIYDQL